MRTLVTLAALALLITPAAAKDRLFVLSDIGNEPDDQMSLVRLLVYANEIDIEGFVATTSTWQRDTVRPDIARGVIEAYGKSLPSLRRHAEGWPDEETLLARLTSGVAGYGIEAALADAPVSEGALALIAAADRQDDRPLWVTLWGGANTLAQALDHVRNTRSPDDLSEFVRKLRVYGISDQDDAGPWIRREFPGLFYIVKPSTQDGEEYAYATWTGIAGDEFYRNGAGADFTTVTNEWLDDNVRVHGPLGAAYPHYLFIMEGDTPSFLALIPNGLQAAEHPNWGGWGGRYLLRQPYGETRPIWTQGGDAFPRVTSADTVNGVTSDHATIWRWREAFQHDFAARMSWTVKSFEDANHPPVPAVNGDETLAPLIIETTVGETVTLDAAASSDPDGDALTWRWFHYGEAGFGDAGLAQVEISGAGTARAEVTATSVCLPNWLDYDTGDCPGEGTAHIILELTDNGDPVLTRYRRVILKVGPARNKD